MTADPIDINALIEASSLGTPEAAALRASVSDETARQIVARSDALCDVDAYDLDRAAYKVRLELIMAYNAGRAEGRTSAAREVERPDSMLCNCPRIDSPPTNPSTKAAMDHHCDCQAVEAAATMLGAYSLTVHARQCGHGADFDAFYARRAARIAEEPTRADD